MELVIPTMTQKLSQNKSSTHVTSIATTVPSSIYLSWTSTPSQLATSSGKINTSATMDAGPCGKPGEPTQETGLSITASTLGGLLGLSLVLLALVTTGWIWMCWTVSNRGGMMINSKQNK